MKETIYCYHHNKDLDGFFSAAVTLMKYPNVELCGLNYDDKVDLVKNYDKVFMIDLSLSVDQMKQLQEDNKEFIWIDHHARTIVEAEQKHGFCPQGLRDSGNQFSACVLAWKYFYEDKIPRVLEIVQDLDLWRFKIEETKLITATLTSIAWNYPISELLYYLYDNFFSNKYTELVTVGSYLLDMQEGLVKKSIEFAGLVKWNGYKAIVVNTNCFASEVGHSLLKKHPEAEIAIVWSKKRGLATVSLRSRGNVDVSKIAKKYGGGGHKPAAGFHVPFSDWINDIFILKGLQGNVRI